MISPSFAAVILAAGESLRMGRDKALLPFPAAGGGATFLGANIERLTRFAEMVIVVGGANSDSLKPEIFTRGAYLVTNPEPERGQLSSLQVGLQEVLNRGRDAAIVTHTDRIPAQAETLTELLAAFRTRSRTGGTWAVVPEFDGQHGHPIVIGREMMEKLLRAPQGSTARDVEHANQEHVFYLAVKDVAVLKNVNTPQEYAALSASAKLPA